MSNHGKPRRHRRDSTDLPDQQQNIQSAVNTRGLLTTPTQQPVQYMLVPVPVTPTGQYQEQSPIPQQFYQHSPIPAQYFVNQLPSDQYLQPHLLPQASRTPRNLSNRGQKSSKGDGNLNITVDDTDDDDNRPQLRGFARSDDTQADIPDVDDNDVFKFIIKTFGGGCTYNDFSRKCDLFEDKSRIPRWFSKHSRRFKIYRDGRKIVYISPFYHDMKLCAIYNKQFGNCINTNCDFFHVCRKFVWGHCKNRDCKLSHSFKTTDNRQLKEKLGITDFTDTDIKVVLNANSPSVCYDYLYNEGCKILNYEKRCPYLHLCRDHVFKKCKTPCKHNMTHSIKQFHNNWVLTSCRMHNWSEERILKYIYVPPKKHEQLDESEGSDLSFDDYDEDDIGLSSDYVDSESDNVIKTESDQQFGHHLIRSVENISSHSDAAKPQKDRKVDRMSRFKSSDSLLQRDDQKSEKASVTKDLGFRDVPKSRPALEHYDVDPKREAKMTEMLMMRYGHMDAETQIPSSWHYIDDGKTKEKENSVIRRRYSAMETQQPPSRHVMDNTQNIKPTQLIISRGHTDTETQRSVLEHYDDDKKIKEKERLMMHHRHMDAEIHRPSAMHNIDDKDTKENEHLMNRLGYIDTERKRPVIMHYDDYPKGEEEGRLRNIVRRKNMDKETYQPALVHYDDNVKTKEKDPLMVRRGYIDMKGHQPASRPYDVGVANRTTEKEREIIMPMDQLKQKQRVDDVCYRKDDMLQSQPDILHSHNKTGQDIKGTERLLMEPWKMQQRVLGKTSGRPLPPTPMFKRGVIKSDCEDNDQALLKDESSEKNICIFVLREMCSSHCKSYHLSSGTPYLWQLQMFGTWVPLASSENEITEKRFCDLQDSVSVKIVNDNIKFRYRIYFDNTIYGILRTIDGQPGLDDNRCAVRRLSTPSYAEEPTHAIGSYVTHWKWYFRDDAHTWTICDKDIQLGIEENYLLGNRTHSFKHDNFTYTISFENMTQLNLNTKRTRQITRRPLSASNAVAMLNKLQV